MLTRTLHEKICFCCCLVCGMAWHRCFQLPALKGGERRSIVQHVACHITNFWLQTRGSKCFWLVLSRVVRRKVLFQNCPSKICVSSWNFTCHNRMEMVDALKDVQALKPSGLLDRVDTPQAKALKDKILGMRTYSCWHAYSLKNNICHPTGYCTCYINPYNNPGLSQKWWFLRRFVSG